MSLKTAAVVAIAAAAATGAAAGDVKELTPATFDDTIFGGSAHHLVEFFAPWCGHCKALAPKFEEAAGLFKGTSAALASVDCDAHGELCSKFGVRGYPTLKYFAAGATEPEDYEGAREVTDLVSFVNKKAGTNVRVKTAPSHVIAATDASLRDILADGSRPSLLEFYAPWCGHCKRLAPDYEKLGKAFAAEPVNIVKVDATENSEYASKFGVTGYPTLLWMPAGADEPVKYTGGRSLADFVSYINDAAGTEVAPDGGVLPTAGRVAALDELAREFKSASDRAAVLAKAEAAAASDDVKGGKNGAFAKFYTIAMKRAIEKGDDFFATEKARLARMADSDSVKPDKAASFRKRINILAAFE